LNFRYKIIGITSFDELPFEEPQMMRGRPHTGTSFFDADHFLFNEATFHVVWEIGFRMEVLISVSRLPIEGISNALISIKTQFNIKKYA
jgi:hypothetical protein